MTGFPDLLVRATGQGGGRVRLGSVEKNRSSRIQMTTPDLNPVEYGSINPSGNDKADSRFG